MKIAILSDSHDHIPNVREAVRQCNQRGCALLIHCGDLISPFMLDELAAFTGAVHLVYGNNVGDQHLISSSCGARFPSLTQHGVLGEVEAGGLKIAFTHYPQMARGLAALGQFEVVCCGHNHRRRVEEIGHTLLVNPGELLGKDAQPSFLIMDCPSRAVEVVEVGRRFFSD
jgi:putative phosphoesterase